MVTFDLHIFQVTVSSGVTLFNDRSFLFGFRLQFGFQETSTTSLEGSKNCSADSSAGKTQHQSAEPRRTKQPRH